MTLALILLALLAVILSGAGFVVKWLFIVAAVVAVVWLVMVLTASLRRTPS